MLWSAASKRPRGTGGSRLIRRRADLLVVEQGLAESRHQAQALILAGEIWRLETRIEKPGEQLPADTILRLRSRRPRFVGRGGNKLEGALSRLGVDPEGVLAWDIGASTGAMLNSFCWFSFRGISSFFVLWPVLLPCLALAGLLLSGGNY